jgi:hypothetical protein
VPSRLRITINARVSPEDRHSMYEDQLETALRTRHPGLSVTGGGTLTTAENEPLACDIDFEIATAGEGPAVLRLAIRMLEAAGAPKGSRARLDGGEPVRFGAAEGLAIYLNGIDLPDEVYGAASAPRHVHRHVPPRGAPVVRGGERPRADRDLPGR